MYDVAQLFPELRFVINGGVETFDQAESHLKHVQGAMIGRAAYNTPLMFASADERFYSRGNEFEPKRTRRGIMRSYIEKAIELREQEVYGSG